MLLIIALLSGWIVLVLFREECLCKGEGIAVRFVIFLWESYGDMKFRIEGIGLSAALQD